MAKQEKVTLDDLINWASKYSDAIVPRTVEDNIEWVPTGIPSFDYLFGKGIPLGRIIEFYGREQSGKTTISYWLISKVMEYTKKPLFYIDAEQSLSYEWMAANGLSDDFAKQIGILDEHSDWIVISQSIELETVFSLIEKFVSSDVIGAVLLDSISVLIPKSQADVAFEDMSRDIATFARALTVILKRITKVIAQHNVPLFIINQPRESINVSFGERERTPGGRILKHLASVRVKVWRHQQLKKGDRVVGNVVGLEVVKNKVAPPFRRIYAVIYYDSVSGMYGFDPIASLVYDLVIKKVLSSSGAWYTVGGKKYQGIDALIEAAREDENVFSELKTISEGYYAEG